MAAGETSGCRVAGIRAAPRVRDVRHDATG